PVQVRQVLGDWSTSTSFGLHGPRIGTDVTENWIPMTGLGQGSTTWLDVTSFVRNWQAGAPNHGIHLKTSTADNWNFFWPGMTLAPDLVPRLRITILDESAPVETPFELWADAQELGNTALDSDDDKDGIKLLVEYALGLSGKNADVLPALVRDGSNLTISFAKGVSAAADSRVGYQIMTSTDLVEWVPDASAVETSGAISLSHPVGAGPKFFRLKVTYTP
ncbi:MAG TPA: hypothetical protein VM511_09285, partial [Luteolibacter sp.]|nr:hypothetical protein [Luteolibacter sp.]